jgi:hypothetical protein
MKNISRNYMTDEATNIMREEVAAAIWKKQNRTGTPSMGEEHRIVIQYAHNVMFPDDTIDISTAIL